MRLTIAQAPLNTPLVAMGGQYAGFVIVVKEKVLPATDVPTGWESSGPGWANGTITTDRGSTYGASFPLDVTVRVL